jgi:hypothetical protein
MLKRYSFITKYYTRISLGRMRKIKKLAIKMAGHLADI